MHRHIKQIAIFTLVASIAAALAGCNSGNPTAPGSGGGNSDVAATVNGTNIMLSEIDRIITQKTTQQQVQMSPLQLADAR